MLSRAAYLLSWAPVAVVLSDTLCTAHHERTTAMSPAVPQGATVLVSRAVRPATLSRGDVVTVSSADGRRRLLRRVIALPGDYVRTRAALLADAPPTRDTPLAVVPPGFVWLQADRRDADADGGDGEHADSDDYGAVPVAMITGRATRFLPSGRRVASTKADRVFEPTMRYS